ncbi:MAG: 2-oxoglutarate dehydrogenase complex dihydrolipoyllysine-residue succinyltransferase [Bacteroidia bacterium]|nr:2-oxoglutarate dehydrogenase complex dihydrolipoyllysine-residue succinyltransferase [Bacteroidia bacterium]
MVLEMKVPSPGESITEVTIGSWLKKEGDYVEQDEILAEIESDKAMLTLNAEVAGSLKILVSAGTTVKVGDTVCSIDTSAAKTVSKTTENHITTNPENTSVESNANGSYTQNLPSVSAQKMINEQNIDTSTLQGTGRGGRITKTDIIEQGKPKVVVVDVPNKEKSIEKPAAISSDLRAQRSEKMSQLRKRLAQRLVSVKNETAMLTTFNEVDMSGIMDLRAKYKELFKTKHDIGLGFMSFFTKAVTIALADFPVVNAQIQGDEILFSDYADVGIAVSTERGLVVPILRNTELMSLADIEKTIISLANKARAGKLSIDEMTGGTFTITNGGVFGSLLSTPIINPPQSAILGMHNIVERPVAVEGQVVIRPMMYIALSYDHRIIDGKDSVSFLVRVKQLLEDPARILLGV